MNKLKSSIKSLFPQRLWDGLHNFRMYLSMRSYRSGNQHAEEQVKHIERPLNVLFLVVWESQWKCDSVFQMMLKDPNFKPQILVCNIVDRGGRQYMLDTMEQCFRYFEKKGYPCVRAYDEKTDSYIDPYQFNPDIVFFTNPYEGVVNERYLRPNFKDILTCYVNYLYVSNNKPWSCASYFHRSLWRYYIEYPLLLEQINNFTAPFQINGRVVGYPLFDAFRQYKLSDADWPIAGKRKRRIIWAPHHSITGHTGINAFSTFERYYDFMLKIAEKYKDEIQMVFKPHPTLKSHLYEAKDWGKERTDAYYEKWAKGENTSFVDGEYVGLFMASDAMMHDCHSFTVEYLVTNRPAMFLDSGKTDDKLNAVGKEARACYYKGQCEEDIEEFIQKIIAGDEDSLKEKREEFLKHYILPPNGKLAAVNIIDDLLTSLGRKK